MVETTEASLLKLRLLAQKKLKGIFLRWSFEEQLSNIQSNLISSFAEGKKKKKNVGFTAGYQTVNSCIHRS